MCCSMCKPMGHEVAAGAGPSVAHGEHHRQLQKEVRDRCCIAADAVPLNCWHQAFASFTVLFCFVFQPEWSILCQNKSWNGFVCSDSAWAMMLQRCAGEASGHNDSADFPVCSRYKWTVLFASLKVWDFLESLKKLNLIRPFSVQWSSCFLMSNTMSLDCTVETRSGSSLQRNAPLQFPPETHAKNNALPSAYKECEYPEWSLARKRFDFILYSKRKKTLSLHGDFWKSVENYLPCLPPFVSWFLLILFCTRF